MQLSGPVQQVWIFIGESDQWHGQSLYMAILELLRREGCAGATVLRGIAGFGAHSRIRTSTLVDLSVDLPIVVTFVDRSDRVARVMPTITEMVEEGMITMLPVDVVKYTHRAIKPFPAHLTVADVMTHTITTVTPDTPIGDLVTLLLDQSVRALPVVDEQQHVLGIVTDGDLLRRGAIDLPIRLQQSLPLPQRAAVVAALASHPQRAADVMTPDPHIISRTCSLAQAARQLVTLDLKRLPVVDEQAQLVGMVSRGDLLATVVEGLRQRPDSPILLPTGAPQMVADVMRRDIPTVLRSTPLSDALDEMLQTPQRRVVVVDEQRQVVGIITDGDVLRRAARQVQPSLLQRLAGWFSGGEFPPELTVVGSGRLAADVMTSPVITIPEDTPIIEAIHRLMTAQVLRMPVVDANGQFVGMVGRAGLLQALVHPGSSITE